VAHAHIHPYIDMVSSMSSIEAEVFLFTDPSKLLLSDNTGSNEQRNPQKSKVRSPSP
jgi:hypothetical protein